MIIAPTSSYFLMKAEGEAAASLISEVCPKVANDIEIAILISADFDVDIAAINNMDKTVDHLLGLTGGGLQRNDTFNPLYIPSKMEEVDEMLSLEPMRDNVKFVGMNGSPYTLKTIEVTSDGEPVITAKVQYREFDLPAYSDIVASHEQLRVN